MYLCYNRIRIESHRKLIKLRERKKKKRKEKNVGLIVDCIVDEKKISGSLRHVIDMNGGESHVNVVHNKIINQTLMYEMIYSL